MMTSNTEKQLAHTKVVAVWRPHREQNRNQMNMKRYQEAVFVSTVVVSKAMQNIS